MKRLMDSQSGTGEGWARDHREAARVPSAGLAYALDRCAGGGVPFPRSELRVHRAADACEHSPSPR